MFTRDGGFHIDGHTYFDSRHTSDGLVAVFNNRLDLWQYFRLNWKTERYEYVGSTDEFHDPNLEAYDRLEVYPVVRSLQKFN
jgi:hypothetical protein